MTTLDTIVRHTGSRSPRNSHTQGGLLGLGIGPVRHAILYADPAPENGKD